MPLLSRVIWECGRWSIPNQSHAPLPTYSYSLRDEMGEVPQTGSHHGGEGAPNTQTNQAYHQEYLNIVPPPVKDP